MKKFLVAILALVYLASSSGAVVNLHYGMGKLKSWDLSHTSRNTCGNCGMEKANKGCCHDEQKQLQTAKDQQLTVLDFQFCTASTAAVIHDFASLSILFPVAVLQPVAPVMAPPGPGKVSIFIRQRNFRI